MARRRSLEEIDGTGAKTTATYAANGDRLTLKLPKGNEVGAQDDYEWSFTYSSFGEILEATDPTGRVFEFDYNVHRDLWKIGKPDHLDQGQIIMSEWTYGRDFGTLTSISDPFGNAWTRTRDDAGRMIQLVGPAGTEFRYGFDARFRVTSVTVEDGVYDPVTTYGYDNQGRLATKTLDNGAVWSYTYDDSGRLASKTDPLNRTWVYGRDFAEATKKKLIANLVIHIGTNVLEPIGNTIVAK